MMLRYLIPAALLLAAVPAAAAVPVTGRWYSDQKDSIIEIAQCGAVVCGRVIKILKPNPKGSYNPVDENNPDPKLRTRPILGLVLLAGFKDAGSQWTGTIYDPRRGQVFKSTMLKLANGNLKVSGCWGIFCQSVQFTPAR